MKRYASIIRLRAEKLDEYVRLHESVWPGVLETISRCNIANYSIYLKQLDDGEHYLTAYFEYHGDDFAADMRRMAADPTTREWWKLTDPCQEPIERRAPGEWWASLREVFHHD